MLATALPGLLLLICMSVRREMALLGAGIGIVGTLGIALITQRVPEAARIIPVMDSAWREVVQERSADGSWASGFAEPAPLEQ
jgi:hypothetical protein